MHVIGPELGLSQPGMTIVCGDSHTSTHGAVGALAFGIGTSEVEHVLATQTLPQRRPKTMLLDFVGSLPLGVTAKDVILGAIGRIGVAGGAGYVIEYAGDVIRSLPMSGRMTICNMSIEAGARAGMIAPDDTTFAYLEGRPAAPKGAEWERALDRWRALPSDPDAAYDRVVELDVGELAPQVSWGTNPGMVVAGRRRRPRPLRLRRPGGARRRRARSRLHGARAGDADPGHRGRPRVHRLLHERAHRGPPRGGRASSRASASIRACARWSFRGLPASSARPRTRGSTAIFEAAGFEWRRAGCSMCLGMNPDILQPGERCASTSNRNFEGRQGRGGRTHLVSPAMAAAAALAGHFVDVRELSLEPRRVKPFTRTTGRVAVLDRGDVDTDQIIPKQFLKRIERTGFGEFLFFDWAKEPDFELNQPGRRGSPHPRHRAELRLRLVPRARRLGAPGLRLRGRSWRPRSATSSGRTR